MRNTLTLTLMLFTLTTTACGGLDDGFEDLLGGSSSGSSSSSGASRSTPPRGDGTTADRGSRTRSDYLGMWRRVGQSVQRETIAGEVKETRQDIDGTIDVREDGAGGLRLHDSGCTLQAIPDQEGAAIFSGTRCDTYEAGVHVELTATSGRLTWIDGRTLQARYGWEYVYVYDGVTYRGTLEFLGTLSR
ncbi:MAG: hypothetical protein ACK4N5_23055 [Myxococcales bacterium]